jgi:hypothetical protein
MKVFLCSKYSTIYPALLIIGVQQMLDYCLELSKIKALKMIDLQTKSAIDSDNIQV